MDNNQKLESKKELKENKNARILSIYNRLCEGKSIKKKEEVDRFHVNERTIQRDIDDIRAFLSECTASDGTDNRTIESDRSKKVYTFHNINFL